jgi:hypothetical protein
MLLYSFLGFLLILWLAKLQRDHTRERDQRRERQQRQRVGIEPIPGATGRPHPTNPDEEEQRLLAILRERQQGKCESGS